MEIFRERFANLTEAEKAEYAAGLAGKEAMSGLLTPVLRNIYEIGTNGATEFVEKNEWIVGAITDVAVVLGALTAAVAGIATAVATWVSASQEAGESTKALLESVEESKTAYEENAVAMELQQEATAALEDLLSVEEKSAAQKEAIKKMADELNESVLGPALAYDETGESINMDADALERFVEKAAKQEEYEAQVSRLSELYREQAEISVRLEAAQDALSEAQEMGSGNMRKLQNDINELTAAQKANAQQIAELEEASREYGEQQAEAAQKTKGMTSRIDEINGKMNELQEEYEKSHAKARESIDSQLGLFNELDGTAKTSIDNLIGTLKGQVEYMETYAQNIQRAMEMGVDEGLVRKLSDGSEESALPHGVREKSRFQAVPGTTSVSGGPQHLKYGEFTLTWNYNSPFALGRTVTQ